MVTSTKHEQPSLGQLRMWADQAAMAIAATGGAHAAQAPPGTLVFCTAIHERWGNAPAALMCNLLTAWPYRRFTRFAWFCTGRDSAFLTHLVRNVGVALDAGMLRIASGSQAAESLVRANKAKGPWAEMAPTNFRQFTAQMQRGEAAPPRLQDWHASWHKNTSHVFGEAVSADCDFTQHGPEGSAFLVNLDADNVLAPPYIDMLLQHVLKAPLKLHSFVSAGHPHPPATCGRVGCFAEMFRRIGGYDTTEAAPSGYQDVDLRNRLRRAQRQSQAEACVLEVAGWQALGGAFSNDTTNPIDDRNDAKIASTSSEDRARWPTWNRMNEHNVSMMKARLASGEIVRNSGMVPHGWWVEADNWQNWAASHYQPARPKLHTTAASSGEAAPPPPPTAPEPAATLPRGSVGKEVAAGAVPATPILQSPPPPQHLPASTATRAEGGAAQSAADVPWPKVASPFDVQPSACVAAPVPLTSASQAAPGASASSSSSGAAAAPLLVRAPLSSHTPKPPPPNAWIGATSPPPATLPPESLPRATVSKAAPDTGLRPSPSGAPQPVSRLHLVVTGYKRMMDENPCSATCPPHLKHTQNTETV